MREGRATAGWSPPSPSTNVVVAAAVAYVVVFLYAVLVRASVLLGLVPAFALAGLYVVWRSRVALAAVADGVYRVADQRERARVRPVRPRRRSRPGRSP